MPVLMAYGIGVEILQYFTPWRSFSVADMLADATGIILFWLVWQQILKRTQAQPSI
jgi:VanZ family protein